MESNILQMIKEDAKNVNILIAEDDLVMQGLYKRLFKDMFANFTMVNDGAQAYEYFCDEKNPSIDLIITDNYMPNMGGIELVEKIREINFNVRIIVMTSEHDLTAIKKYTLSGVDAILPKPYDEELTMRVLQRTLHYIGENKFLEHYIGQLELMAKENVVRKGEELKNRTLEERSVKMKKAESVQKISSESPIDKNTLIQKYNIRQSIKAMEDVNVEDFDIRGKERMDDFREKLSSYELLLYSIENNDVASLRLVLEIVLEGVKELIDALDMIGIFPVASHAATNLIIFIENLGDEALKDKDKQELFIDILATMLGDFDKWIDLVFISKSTDNIHYFDASFANTCLELEMVFKINKPNTQDEDNLEFF